MNRRFCGIKKGFTLAEVLITLGIIGVVAAMTIPTLIQNTNSVKFAAQFKKTVSTLSQAALMAQAQYDVNYQNAGGVSDPSTCGSQALTSGQSESEITICSILNSTLAGQTFYGKYGTNNVKAANGSGQYAFDELDDGYSLDPDDMLVYGLADGSYVGFNPNAVGCHLGVGSKLADAMAGAVAQQGTQGQEGYVAGHPAGALNNCLGFVDVNGPTGPNKQVSCSNPSDTKLDPSDNCEIAMTGSAMGDVFPIVFHDGTVEPATNAAKMALVRSK